MADNEIASQQNTRFSILRRKLSKLFSNKPILVGFLCILIGLVVLVFLLYRKTPHEKASEIKKQANQLAIQGKFNDSTQNLLAAYDAEDKTISKAGIAYTIGSQYYVMGSNAEGKKWLEKSAEDYKKAGDNQSAQNALDKIVQLESINKTSNINNGIIEQNAERRGNVTDSNL